VSAEVDIDAERRRIMECIRTNVPYFGPYGRSGDQLRAGRSLYMRSLVRRVCQESDSFRLLELGAWSGQSTILWAANAKYEFERLGKPKNVLVMCIDIWGVYPSLQAPNEGVAAMLPAAESDEIIEIFLHNIKAAGQADVVVPLRASTRLAHQFLQPGFWDVVYVDADHAYDSVRQDIRDYQPLVKEGGYMAGDDLELQQDEIVVEHARRLRNTDDTVDPPTGRGYHPGVTLAVWEHFGRVISLDGFWAAKREGSGWVAVPLDPLPPAKGMEHVGGIQRP
jgi:hypothetical protein